jgi:hypothetical protein
LTLTEPDGLAISLTRESTATNPLANTTVELVVAHGIDAAGDLNVTDQVVVRSGPEGETRYAPRLRRIKLQSAAIFLIEEQGWKKLARTEMKQRLKDSFPVALAYRPASAGPGSGPRELWKEFGPASSESEPALNTMAMALRPGTILFVVSAEENAPQP